MKRLTILLTIICSYSHGQQSIIDSVRAASPTANSLELAEILRREGIRHKNQGLYQEAETLYLESLSIYKEEYDSIGISNVLNNLALIYSRRGQNQAALEHYYRAIEINEKIRNSSGLIKNYLNIGNFFLDQNDFGQALNYYYLCQDQLSSTDNLKILGSIHIGIGGILLNDAYGGKNLDKAQEEFLTALSIYRDLKDSLNMAKVYNNLGIVSNDKAQFDDAIFFYSKGLSIKDRLGDKYGILAAYRNIGHAYEQKKVYDSCLFYYKKGANIAKELDDGKSYLYILSNLVNIYMETGKADSAALLFDEYNDLRDSIYNEEKSRQLTELQTQYETEKTAQELEQQRTATQEKEQANQVLVAIVIILALLILAVIILFTQRQRAVKNLRDKEEELYQKELSRLQKERDIESLHAMMQGQEKERKRIAEDLHDRLGAKLSAIKLFHASSKGQNGKFQKVDELLNETIIETRKIAHNLAPSALTKYGLVQALQDLLDTLKDSNTIDAKFSAINMEDRVPEEIETALYYICQELVTNTLRHSEATSLSISLSKFSDDNLLNLCYEDNGKGFDPDALQEKSMGLSNVRTRLTPFKGQLSIDSSPGKGVVFIIDIPLHISKELA